MENRRMLLPALSSIALVFSLIIPASPLNMAPATAQGNVTPMIAVSDWHTVGLKSDGTVVAVGENDYGQCDVGNWTDIVNVAVGEYHTVGLKADGTVVATGCTNYEPSPSLPIPWVNVQGGQCNVSAWRDITQVAGGVYHTVGLKADGTVVAVGLNDYGQCDVGNWTNIVQVAAGGWHTVGLKRDRTVVAMGGDYFWQLNVDGWLDIVQVAADDYHTVGLKSDGTVSAVGDNDYGECDVSNWRSIIQITAGLHHTVGRKADGTVVAVGDSIPGQCNVGGWRGIVQVAAGGDYTVGLKSNGTVVATDPYLTTELAKWNLGLVAQPMNWPLIGAIIPAVVVVGLLIFLLRRRGRGPADT